MLDTDTPNPLPASPKGHDTATCGCRVCAKRRRLAGPTRLGEPEAIIGPAGSPPSDPDEGEILDADLPTLVTKHPGDERKSIRPHIAHWIALRSLNPEITIAEAAEKIGITKSTLRTYIYRATKRGWLRFDDPLSRMDYEIVPKVIDNLNFFLDARDKTVTVETAKGTIFKTYAESKGTNTQQTVLALKIEMPDGSETKIVSGHIVGRPKELADDAL